MRLFCYADDTLVVASGGSFGEVAQLAMAGTRLVVGRIQALGLRVSLDKTEALLFHGPRMGPPSGAALVVEGVRISVASSMKYLGLVLDGRWNFEPHFKSLEGRLVRAAGALGKLLPNLGGPCQSVRRLYCGIIRSMALYGAPIWDDALIRRTNRMLIRRPQRVIAVRAARCYRTVSFEAACVLAGTPPWEWEVELIAALYRAKAETKSRASAMNHLKATHNDTWHALRL
ncbi:unnamed protein product [Pieris macdunnoughi]|uniref:Reverse transcriptase domain-containing protein n=1 Tax=Pieris macdunnoughi TaxID=345717 RepID=A0A821WR33_9NEOP|nr:unnamed protein product [Pieris macdunnoughi]